MLFCDISFIFIFLPAFLVIYYITPRCYRNAVLLLGSLLFYALGELKYFSLLVFTLIINYFLAKHIYGSGRKSRNVIFVLLLCYNFGMLIGFKYFSNTIPLGISFYTFQISAYVIDVYRRKTKPAKSIVEIGTYLCMFPQLIAGPIIIYQDIERQIRRRQYSLSKMEEGLKIFVIGLASKVLIADVMGKLWNEVQVVGFESISTPMAWLGAIAYSMQIYFDFNGYSLMAIGLGNMLGFKIPENFDNPYLSRSVSEFFRRWHITLGIWFREYIYIPLGGNREGKLKTVRNLFIVWFFTGMWHGSGLNFLIWGLFSFILIIAEKFIFKKFLNKHRIISRLYMMLYIPINWIIFAIADVNEILVYLRKMFPIGKSVHLLMGNERIIIKTLSNYGIFILIAMFFCSRIPQKFYNKFKGKIFMSIILLFVFWLAIMSVVRNTGNPFLYFRF